MPAHEAQCHRSKKHTLQGGYKVTDKSHSGDHITKQAGFCNGTLGLSGLVNGWCIRRKSVPGHM